jgi:hypothetical protein
MEEVRGRSPRSSTLHQYGSHKVEHRQPARESGGCHSDFTALLVRPGMPPAVQTVQTGPIRRGSQMVKVDAGQGRG